MGEETRGLARCPAGVGRSPWTAADALVGLHFEFASRAGPGGPARTGRPPYPSD
jgi:hypothetical protein